MGYVEDIRALVGHRPLILVGAVAVLVDGEGQVLLQQRKHPEGRWAFPGGLMELGESGEATARREVFEETSLEVGDLRLLNAYSGPEQFLVAPNGDEYYVVTLAYVGTEFQGTAKVNDSESMAVQFFALADIPAGLVKTHRKILDDYLASGEA